LKFNFLQFLSFIFTNVTRVTVELSHNIPYIPQSVLRKLFCFASYNSAILIFFNVHVSVYRKNILIYIQQDATLHSLFYLKTALHVSGGTSTHHQERIQQYLKHLLFVTPLLLPVAIAADSSIGVTNTKCCRYSCMRS
jgi:hypothetical protein